MKICILLKYFVMNHITIKNCVYFIPPPHKKLLYAILNFLHLTLKMHEVALKCTALDKNAHKRLFQDVLLQFWSL